MKLNMKLRKYYEGWRALLKSCVVATIWFLAVMLPAYAFMLLFPDQMEGKADGGNWIRPTCAVILLLWAPLVAGVLGPLRFSGHKKNE